MLSAGARLGPYEVVSPLGAEGMGEVYRALGRDVALKVLPEGALTDDEARRRFRKEADALARLAHPHVATIHDFDSADGTDFLVMELVRGPSLREELEEKGAFPEKAVIRLGASWRGGSRPPTRRGSSTGTSSRRTCSCRPLLSRGGAVRDGDGTPSLLEAQHRGADGGHF